MDGCSMPVFIDAGIIGFEMAKRGLVFPFGDGLVEKDYEKTIRNIGRMGCHGIPYGRCGNPEYYDRKVIVYENRPSAGLPVLHAQAAASRD
jgi:hypothetical protein